MPKRPGAPRRARGGQPRNANAATHRVYSAPAKPLLTLDDLIADLRQRISQLAGMLDSGQGELSPDQFITVAKLYGELASRLGRLLRDQRALSGKAADGLAGAIAVAVDELATETGISVEI